MDKISRLLWIINSRNVNLIKNDSQARNNENVTHSAVECLKKGII